MLGLLTMNARSLLLGGVELASVFALGLLVGRWSVDVRHVGEPESPRGASTPPGAARADVSAAVPRLTGRLPLPAPAVAGGQAEERGTSKDEEDAALLEVGKKIWAEVPETNPGLRWTMLNLARFTHPVLSKKTRREVQILSPDRFVANVLRNPERNPEGWKLSEENENELQALLDESYEQE